MREKVKMNRFFSSLGLAFILTTVFGCAATTLRSGAEKIIVTRNSAPKSCKFLGALVGEQGGALSGPFTSNKNLAQGAWNDLRNKALELGANYVQLEDTHAGNTGSGGAWSNGGGGSFSQTDVTHAGNAYKCPPEEILDCDFCDSNAESLKLGDLESFLTLGWNK